MSTLDEVLVTRHRLSEYHVYHELQQNICITPFLDKKKEFGYKRNRRQHREEAENYENFHRRSDESNSYFLHQPKLLFRDPPRVLRRGSHRNGDPICMIHSSLFWGHWNVQFRDHLGDIIDPRGMVPFENRTRPDNSTTGDNCALKGYKVRTWRFWGESGRAYHQRVNARRRMQQEEGQEVISTFEPTLADQAVQLTWSSPFANPRRYEFQYAGIHFAWKGTRDLPVDNRLEKLLMPLNHLKLVAEVPGGNSYMLALFSSAINSEKCGRLWVFDSVISKLLDEAGISYLEVQPRSGEGCTVSESEPDIRATRLYELIMATSMCMIIGEKEKRLTIYFMLLLIMVAGRSVAGAVS